MNTASEPSCGGLRSRSILVPASVSGHFQAAPEAFDGAPPAPAPTAGAPPPKAARKVLSAEQKNRRRAVAKKRAELDAKVHGNTSRAIADTAFAEVFKRPAFHNYGRYNETNPWVRSARGGFLVSKCLPFLWNLTTCPHVCQRRPSQRRNRSRARLTNIAFRWLPR